MILPPASLLALSTASARHAGGTILLWKEDTTRDDSLNQQAYEAALRSIGFHPMRLAPENIGTATLDSTTLLVAPHASAVRCLPSDVAFILKRMREGLSLITDGDSPLSVAFGITLGKPTAVSRIRDQLRPGLHPFWPDKPRVSWIAACSAPAPRILYSDRATGRPLGALLQIGKGRCIYLAPLFDPRTGRGYGRFATLPDAIVYGLGLTPPFRRNAADAYFDAGYRTGVDVESLAVTWKRWGVRILHAAAWYAYDHPPYDYKALIDACHRNGLLVYAWLEWPYIGKGFWDKHPSWRQRTATLKDAHFDFLYLMDLQNPDCMSAALGDLDSLLTLDWDGVDAAEFTLTGAGKEGLVGPARPDWFTGFTDYCRTEFKDQYGFDPLDFFNPRSAHFWKTDRPGLENFYRYRTRVNVATQRRLFSELHRMNQDQKRGWELVLTIVDNSAHPEFDFLLGFSMPQTVALLQECDVTLQVEDPYLEWTKPPERYLTTGAYYRRLLGDRPFLIDVNVVPMKPDRWSDFSTWQPIGTEVFQYWQHAGSYTGRVCFYSESSVSDRDWELMPYAMAAGASIAPDTAGWRITSPYTVLLEGFAENEELTLDNRPWSANDKGVLIPAGDHTLRRTEAHANSTDVRLLSISGELLDTRCTGTECSVSYTSPQRCAVCLSRCPSRIFLDGSPVALPIYIKGETATVMCPPGAHSLVASIR